MTPVEFHWNSAGTVEGFFSGMAFFPSQKWKFLGIIQSKQIELPSNSLTEIFLNGKNENIFKWSHNCCCLFKIDLVFLFLLLVLLISIICSLLSTWPIKIQKKIFVLLYFWQQCFARNKEQTVFFLSKQSIEKIWHRKSFTFSIVN